MESFELVKLKSGVVSLRALDNLETFHPVTGPVIEAELLHVRQQNLTERAGQIEHFIVWDVGLGAAANALAAIRALVSDGRAQFNKVSVYSFDLTTAPLEFAIKNGASLGYLSGYESTLTKLIENQEVRVSEDLSWYLQLGDFSRQIGALSVPAPHAIFYDPYSAVNNFEMWTLEHFKNLFAALDPTHPCLWTNYTRSTAMRVSLLLAGFYVGVGCGVGEKAETTIASNCLKMLDRPLDLKWLERVRISRNSALLRADRPRGAADETISETDFEKLKNLKQCKTRSFK